MAASPKRIYIRLKTDMKNAYYTDNMVDNLQNFRNEASAFLSGQGAYKNLSFLEICENLEGKGSIGWKNLENLKTLVQSATDGKVQLLQMISKAEREITECKPVSENPLPMKTDANKRRQEDDEIVVYMVEDEYRVHEGHAAFLDSSVDPQPASVVWKKGEKSYQLEERITINNNKYYCSGPKNPTLVIRSAKEKDAAYYQCIAKKDEIAAKGRAVPLKVDTSAGSSMSDGHKRGRSKSRSRDRQSESRSRSTEDRPQRSQAPRGNNWSTVYKRSRLKSRSRDMQTESRSRSREDMYQRRQAQRGAGKNWSASHKRGRSKTRSRDMQSESRRRSREEKHRRRKAPRELKMPCKMKFTLPDYGDQTIVASAIKNGFYKATVEERLGEIFLEIGCIRVQIEIKAANSLSEAPAVCLAEQFKNYLLDGGLQLADESNTVLEVDAASIEITAENMPEDGLPLVHVNIRHHERSVPHSETVILQTYIISSSPTLSIEWFKLGDEDKETPIKIGSKKYYGGSELSPSLIIRNFNADDQGEYICRATNTNGTGCSDKTSVRTSGEPTETEDEPGKSLQDVSATPATKYDQGQDILRIVLIGKTGEGKSATGNTILGKDVFEDLASGGSVTKQCQSDIASRFGKILLVVDTPGIHHTDKNIEETKTEVSRLVKMTIPGPHAIILVVSTGKFTKEHEHTVEHLVDIFGDDMYKYLIVLFTGRDNLERHSLSLETFIKGGTRYLRDLLKKCNNQYIAFDNTKPKAQRDSDAKRLVDLIDEIVEHNGGNCYNNEMYDKARKVVHKREEDRQQPKHDKSRGDIDSENEELLCKLVVDDGCNLM